MSVEQMCQMYGDVRSKGVPRVTFGWCKDMEAFVGKEFIITRVGGDGAVYGLSEVDDSRFTLHTDMIEYVNNDWKAISAQFTLVKIKWYNIYINKRRLNQMIMYCRELAKAVKARVVLKN